MGWTVLYIAFGIVALWLLGEVLLQYKARLRWRLLAFAGFLGVVIGVLIPSVVVIGLGAIAFAVGQTYVTLSFRRGFSHGLGGQAARPGRAAPSAPRQGEPRRSPTLEVSDLGAGESGFGDEAGTTGRPDSAGYGRRRLRPRRRLHARALRCRAHGRRVHRGLRAAAPARRHRLVRHIQRQRVHRGRRPVLRERRPGPGPVRDGGPQRPDLRATTLLRLRPAAVRLRHDRPAAVRRLLRPVHRHPDLRRQGYDATYGGQQQSPTGLRPGPVRPPARTAARPRPAACGCRSSAPTRPTAANSRRSSRTPTRTTTARDRRSGQAQRATGTTSSTASESPSAGPSSAAGAHWEPRNSGPSTISPATSAPDMPGMRETAAGVGPAADPVQARERACCWPGAGSARSPAASEGGGHGHRTRRLSPSPVCRASAPRATASAHAAPVSRAPAAATSRRRGVGAAPAAAQSDPVAHGTVGQHHGLVPVVGPQRRVVRPQHGHRGPDGLGRAGTQRVQLGLAVGRVHDRAVHGAPASRAPRSASSTVNRPGAGARVGPYIALLVERTLRQAPQPPRVHVRHDDGPPPPDRARRPAPRPPRGRPSPAPAVTSAPKWNSTLRWPGTARTPRAPTPACRRGHTRCRRRAPCTAARPRSPERDRGSRPYASA